MNKVRGSAVRVGDIKSEDFEQMNKRKIEQLQSYEQHFSRFFADIKSVHINDAFLNEKYSEICIAISSKTSTYQDLVAKCNMQRQLIAHYQQFKDTVNKDMDFISQFT